MRYLHKKTLDGFLSWERDSSNFVLLSLTECENTTFSQVCTQARKGAWSQGRVSFNIFFFSSREARCFFASTLRWAGYGELSSQEKINALSGLLLGYERATTPLASPIAPLFGRYECKSVLEFVDVVKLALPGRPPSYEESVIFSHGFLYRPPFQDNFRPLTKTANARWAPLETEAHPAWQLSRSVVGCGV